MHLADLSARLDSRKRIRLGGLPTPLHFAPKFSELCGIEVWIKRDDLSQLSAGGNKVRKLEFILGEALAGRSEALVTVGSPQSNHARTVAAVASQLGIECHLVLGGPRPDRPTGSVLLDAVLGPTLHFTARDDWQLLDREARQLTADLERAGRWPCLIPLGGSTPVGALGFVAAYVELILQCRELGLEPQWIVHATSSGGTQAGLETARQLLGRTAPRIAGVAVVKSQQDLAETVVELVRGTSEALGEQIDPDSPVLLDGFIGRGYAIPTAGGLDALRHLLRTEGILADPVYTAKALDAVAHKGRERFGAGPIVFWHTGGQPALFSDEQGLLDWGLWQEQGEVGTSGN